MNISHFRFTLFHLKISGEIVISCICWARLVRFGRTGRHGASAVRLVAEVGGDKLGRASMLWKEKEAAKEWMRWKKIVLSRLANFG